MKQSYIARGKLYLWMREMECKIIGSEMASFNPSLLQYYDVFPDLEDMTIAISVDPVPPPSETALSKGLKYNDWEVWSVVGKWIDRATGKRKFFLLEQKGMKGHDPEWSVNTFFELLDRWHPTRLRVESIGYQRTLKWLLERAMQQRRRYIPVDEPATDRRKKLYRIIDVIGDKASRKELYVHRSQEKFIEQYISAPALDDDDFIESAAMAIECADQMDVLEGEYTNFDESIPDLEWEESCP